MGFVTNLVQGIFSRLQSLLVSSFQALLNVAGLALRAFGAALAGATGLLAGFTAALSGAVKGALQFAAAALSLRASTGLSLGAAGYLQARGTAFGMSAADTKEAFGNPFMGAFGMGNRPTDPHFFSKLASTYQPYLNSGPMGVAMGQGMLAAQLGGKPSDSTLSIASMSPGKIKEQENWFNSLYSRMGLGTKDIQQFSETIPLLLNRLNVLREVGFLRLAAAVGPSLVAGLERVVSFFTRNADRIVPIVERLASTFSKILVRGLETTLNFLERVDFASIIENAFNWLLESFPPLLMSAGAVILSVFGNLLVGFSGLAQGLSDNLVGVLSIFDLFLNGLRTGAAVLGGIVSAIAQAVSNLGLIVPGISGGAPSIVPGGASAGASGGNAASGGPSGGPGMPQNIGVQPVGYWSGFGTRLKAGLIGAGVGWGVGTGVGATVGGGIGYFGGGLAGGVAGLGAGGVGAVAGATAGAGIFGPLGAQAGGAIGGLFGALYGGIQAMRGVKAIQSGAQQANAQNAAAGPGGTGIVNRATNIVNGMAPVAGQGVFASFGRGYANTLNNIGVSNLSGDTALQGRLQTILKGDDGKGGLINKSATAGNSLLGVADSLNAGASGWADTLKNIEKNTGVIADKAKEDSAAEGLEMVAKGLDVLGRAMGYRAIDQALAARRG